MLLFGEFRNINNELIKVQILTNQSDKVKKEVSRENGLWFSSDPIHIETDISDTFETLIRKSCTINLITNGYMGAELFADNSRSAEVTITKEDEVIFFGFLEANTFDQPFAKPLEEFSLNCIDALSTLQYYKYKDITLNNFEGKKKLATNITFKGMLDLMFESTICKRSIFYDLSKGISANRTENIFDDLAMSEQYVIGEDYDDTWTYEDVLIQILQYLNLHIIQNGYDYYIFDWDSIRNGNEIWFDITRKTRTTFQSQQLLLTSSMHGADDTSITVADVYNQIAVKDKLESMDDVIISPLNKDSLYSMYSGKQLYMTEYISEGSGDNAVNAIRDMIKGRPTQYENASEVDWYMQAMNNKNWRFYYDGNNLVDTLAEKNGNTYINQWKIPYFLRNHQLVPYIFKFGSVKHKPSATDDKPISKIKMDNYLYISVNGNEFDKEDTHSPTDTTIANSQPMIEYIGNNSGGIYSPTDDDTTNYLVFSGKITLQPIVYESQNVTHYTNGTGAQQKNAYYDALMNTVTKTEGSSARVPYYSEKEKYYNGDILFSLSNLVKSDNNDEGRYYVRKFWTVEKPSDTPISYLRDGTASLQPPTELIKRQAGYEYKYSAKGDGTDQFRKLPILECELIIGNKRLIETNINEKGESTFEWVTIGSEPTQTYVDSDGATKSYKVTTFSLGVNPTIGDYIIGQEHDIQNTIDYTMNIDAEGTAIPIKKSDHIVGAVIFRILGPVNCLWNDITRRHPTFFRHTKWYENSKFVLAHTENIIVKDFECKIYSNNGNIEEFGDNDLIYMSDETDRFVNKKDNIEFQFITQLGSQESLEKGISPTINMNAVINNNTNTPLDTIYNSITGETAKAEEHYADQYYKEYSTPKILMSATMHNNDSISFNNTYKSSVLNKDFFIQSMNYDVRMNNKEITFKEL